MKLFPTLIHHSKAKVSNPLLKKILKESYAFQAIDPNGQQWSNDNYWGGYTSYGSISDLPHRSTTFQSLKNLIDIEVKKFSKKLGWDLEGGSLEMSTCWINIMGTGCHHSFHLHPHSVISGTVYIEVPKDSGIFKIEDPRIACFQGTPNIQPKVSMEQQRYFKLHPKAGDILLFESWLKHEVTANYSKKERVSISFNYRWRLTT